MTTNENLMSKFWTNEQLLFRLAGNSALPWKIFCVCFAWKKKEYGLEVFKKHVPC